MSIDNFLAGYEIKYAGYGAANCTVAHQTKIFGSHGPTPQRPHTHLPQQSKG